MIWLLLVAACSGGGEAATTSTSAPPVVTTTVTTLPATTPSTTTAPPTTSAPSTSLSFPAVTIPPEMNLGDLAGWELTMVSVGETSMVVALADDSGERAQGLMGVEDLGQVEGMLFVFPEEGPGGFWMKDTLLHLDIAFFTTEGDLVEVLTMEPCSVDPCPLYVPAGEFRFALEVPAGRFDSLPEDATLAIP